MAFWDFSRLGFTNLPHLLSYMCDDIRYMIGLGNLERQMKCRCYYSGQRTVMVFLACHTLLLSSHMMSVILSVLAIDYTHLAVCYVPSSTLFQIERKKNKSQPNVTVYLNICLLFSLKIKICDETWVHRIGT